MRGVTWVWHTVAERTTAGPNLCLMPSCPCMIMMKFTPGWHTVAERTTALANLCLMPSCPCMIMWHTVAERTTAGDNLCLILTMMKMMRMVMS